MAWVALTTTSRCAVDMPRSCSMSPSSIPDGNPLGIRWRVKAHTFGCPSRGYGFGARPEFTSSCAVLASAGKLYPKTMADLFFRMMVDLIPGADQLVQRLLTLPTHPRLTGSELNRLASFYAAHCREQETQQCHLTAPVSLFDFVIGPDGARLT